MCPTKTHCDPSAHLINCSVFSNVKHQLTGSEYPERRAACLDSARLMEKESLRDVTMSLVEEYRERMGELAFRRVRHVVTEIER